MHIEVIFLIELIFSIRMYPFPVTSDAVTPTHRGILGHVVFLAPGGAGVGGGGIVRADVFLGIPQRTTEIFETNVKKSLTLLTLTTP